MLPGQPMIHGMSHGREISGRTVCNRQLLQSIAASLQARVSHCIARYLTKSPGTPGGVSCPGHHRPAPCAWEAEKFWAGPSV